jgi:hypothetical protein
VPSRSDERLGLAASSFIIGPPFFLPAIGIASGELSARLRDQPGGRFHGQRERGIYLSSLCGEPIIPPA